MTGLLDGQRAVWQWQYSAQAEQTPAEVAVTCQQFAGAAVWLIKCMDGQDWQATYDRGQHAIGSLGDWQSTRGWAQQAGITAVPWVVPNGPGDAAAHAQLGPVLVVDAEPYPGFWGSVGLTPSGQAAAAQAHWGAPAAQFPAYLDGLRQGGVSELYISIDPRPAAMTALGVASWAAGVDGLLPQLYWTDFGSPAMATLPYLERCLALNTACYPALPFNAGAVDLIAFWNSAAAAGCTGASLWRLGAAAADQLRAFRALPVTQAPLPDPCAPLRQQNLQLTTQVATLRQQIAAARAALGGSV